MWSHFQQMDKETNTSSMLIGQLIIINVHKPPGVQLCRPALPTTQDPAVFMNNFNGHLTWPRRGYTANNTASEELTHWASTNDIFLLFDAKQCVTFNFAKWGTGYRPDLMFISKGDTGTHTGITVRPS